LSMFVVSYATMFGCVYIFLAPKQQSQQ
jgi:hypothetical protein